MGVVLSRAELVKGLEPFGGLDVNAVRATFRQFEELCPTPALWERAFQELFGCFPTPEASAKAFQVLDTDGNGLVDAREIIGSLAVLSKGHLTDRMALLFDIYDLNGSRELAFDECFMMFRRTMAGLRKMIGILTPPETVTHNMTKQVWKNAKKHRDIRLLLEEWHTWWMSDSSIRSALRMVTWKPEEQRGLPTPDQFVNVDYTKGHSDDRNIGEALSPARGASRPAGGLRASMTRSLSKDPSQEVEALEQRTSPSTSGMLLLPSSRVR